VRHHACFRKKGKTMSRAGIGAAVIIITIGAGFAPAQLRSEETQVVETATQVLDDISADPLRGVPKSLLSQAQAVAIVPDVLKGGFFVGARHGRGVLLVRDGSGHWRAPVFVTLSGGSFGWQIGLQSSDVVLVFRTRKSVDTIMKGKFTIGADASVAAGPVGRQAAAGTDLKLDAEVYSYARSRGLFAGLALDGTAMLVDKRATGAYYGPPPMPGQPVTIPASAAVLVEHLSRYTDRPIEGKEPTIVEVTPATAPAAVPALELARRQLVDATLKMESVLPDAWKRYLALPTEVFTGKTPPTPDAVALALSHYATVSKEARFATLAGRPEFRTAYEALTRYEAALRAGTGTLDLPPPPPK